MLIAFFIRALVSQLNYGVKKNKMGDIKRKRKLFSRPKKLFDRARMDEENVLI